MRLQAEGEVSNFVEGLGPGQLVGRQALAAVNYGDIQLSICERRGNVEVEVIRARNLMSKPGARMLPCKCALAIFLLFLSIPLLVSLPFFASFFF